MQRELEVERALLGGMLIDKNEIDNVIGTVIADDFIHPSHRHIFNAIEKLHSEGDSCDMMSVAKQVGLLGIPGLSTSALGALVADCPSTECESWAGKVAESGRHRRMLEEAKSIVSACVRGDADGIDLAMKKINDIHDGGHSTRKPITLSTGAWQYVAYLEALETGTIANWKTGISLFDDKANQGLGSGLRTKQLLMCCGRAGAGKTTTALYLVKELLRRNKDLKAAFFSLELSSTSLSGKVVRSEMVHTSGEKGEEFIASARAGAKKIESRYGERISIIDHTGMTPTGILGQARKLAKEGAKVFVIDHLHRISYPSLTELRHQIGDFCKRLTDFAKDYDCMFIVCAQLNRESEKLQRPPTTADIAESGQVEQHADIILAVHPVTERVKNRLEVRRGQVYMSLLKNRHGPVATHRFNVNHEHQRFTEMEEV